MSDGDTVTATSAKPRLWVVSELFYPEQTSTGYFLTHIAAGLTADYDIQILCGQPTYSERGLKAPRKEKYRDMTIRRMPATHFNKDRLILRMINAVTLTLSITISMLWHFRSNDRMLIVTNPPTLPPLAAAVCFLKRSKGYLLVHDVYPEILAATGFLRQGSPVYRAIQNMMRRTFCTFDHVITLGRDMRQLVLQKTGMPPDKVHIIPNWGDVDEILPVDREVNIFAKTHDLVNHCIIQFSGNIGRTHDIDSIIKAAEQLAYRQDILFLFVGYGGKTPIIEDAIRDGKAANIKFLARQPRELLGPMLACSDATIISFEKSMLGISVPSRMYNVMSAATPIIAMAEPGSELAMTVQENGAGWVVQPGNLDQLVEVILTVADNRKQSNSTSFGKNGRAAACQSYTLAHILDQYRKVLR